MKICLYGAGAVGGFIGAHLGKAGCEVNVVEVGATLKALQQHGIRVQKETEFLQQKVNATDNPAALGVQDLIVIAVKAPTLVQVAKGIAPLIGPQTIVMPTMNGLPWWFFDCVGGPYAGTRLEAVDPGGTIAAAIPTRHVVGCVVHGSFWSREPGLVGHGFGKHLAIGEPDGSESERTRSLAALLSKAGFDVKLSRDIRTDIWFKLWGNMNTSPISAITGATLDLILDDPLVNRFCLNIMEEAARIGDRVGCRITQSGEERNAMARELGAFKPSMLQDVELGKQIELDAHVTVVRDIGKMVGEPTTNIDILLGLTRLHAQVHGLYPALKRTTVTSA
ncbi:MAG: 2-dehydropantoate 2-reductase [Candidatus Korobacteraceae bacterium]|jgi:2-dehydropantoate 2-reductase